MCSAVWYVYSTQNCTMSARDVNAPIWVPSLKWNYNEIWLLNHTQFRLLSRGGYVEKLQIAKKEDFLCQAKYRPMFLFFNTSVFSNLYEESKSTLKFHRAFQEWLAIKREKENISRFSTILGYLSFTIH